MISNCMIVYRQNFEFCGYEVFLLYGQSVGQVYDEVQEVRYISRQIGFVEERIVQEVLYDGRDREGSEEENDYIRVGVFQNFVRLKMD